MSADHLACTNCDCRSAEIVRAGGCPRKPRESLAARAAPVDDDLAPHPLANWRELQGPVIAVLIVFVFTTGVGIGAVLAKLP
jgi:hypothetical protein